MFNRALDVLVMFSALLFFSISLPARDMLFMEYIRLKSQYLWL